MIEDVDEVIASLRKQYGLEEKPPPPVMRPGPSNLNEATAVSVRERSLIHRGENVKDDDVRAAAKKNVARDLANRVFDDPNAFEAYQKVWGKTRYSKQIISRKGLSGDAIAELTNKGYRVVDDIGEFRHEFIDVMSEVSGNRVHGWAKTSADADLDAIRYQIAVRQEFGLQNTGKYWDDALEKKALADTDKLALDRVWARKQYELTQDRLERAGIDEVTLFRGVGWKNDSEFMPDWAKPMRVGDKAVQNMQLQPVSSFSSFADDSIDFAMHSAQPFGINNDRQILMTVRVPRAQILSTSRSGMGALNEHEFTVLGGQFDSRVERTIRSTRSGVWNDDRNQFLYERDDQINEIFRTEINPMLEKRGVHITQVLEQRPGTEEFDDIRKLAREQDAVQQEKSDRGDFNTAMQKVSQYEALIRQIDYQIEVVEESGRRGIPAPDFTGQKASATIEQLQQERTGLAATLDSWRQKAAAAQAALRKTYGGVYD